MTVGAPHQEIIACRIFTHLIEHLAQSDKFTGAGGHGHGLARSEQVHKLHQYDFQIVFVMSQSLDGGLEAGDIAVMIRPPDIDERLETARKFILMIGNIGGKICRLAVLADNHTVFLVPVVGCFEPQSAPV